MSMEVDSGYSAGEAITLRENERIRKIDAQAQASTSEKIDAGLFMAAENNIAVKAMTSVVMPSFEPEEGFKAESFTVDALMNTNKIDERYRVPLLKAKSQKELSVMAYMHGKESERRRLSQDILSERQMMGATVVGAVGDIDMILPYGISKLATLAKPAKIQTTMDIAKISFGTEALLSTVRMNIDDNYELGDALADMVIGMGIEVGAISYLNRADRLAKERIINDGVHDNQAIRDAIDDGQFSWSKKQTDDVIDDVVDTPLKPTQQITKKSKEEIEDIEFRKRSEDKKQELKTGRDDALNAIEAELKQHDEVIDVAKQKINDLQSSGQATKAQLNKAKEELQTARNNKKNTKAKRDRNANSNALADDMDARVDIIVKSGLKESIEEIRGILDELSGIEGVGTNAINRQLLELKDTVDAVKLRFPNEMDEVSKMFDSIRNDKSYKPKKLKLTAKQKALIIGAGVVLPTISFAGEGDDYSAGEFLRDALMVGVIGIGGAGLGRKLWSGVKNEGLRASLENLNKKLETSSKISDYSQSKGYKDIGTTRGVLINFLESRVFSSIEPLKKAGGEAGEFAKKLLFDPRGGAQTSIELSKTNFFKRYLRKYSGVERDAFIKWKAKNNIKEVDYVSSGFQHRAMFREAVSDCIEGHKCSDEFVKEVADNFKTLTKEISIEAQKAGVKGFEKISTKGNYLPRLWKYDTISKIIARGGNDIERAKIVEAIENAVAKAMIKSGAPENTALEKAKKLVKGFNGKTYGAKSGTDDMYEQISHLMKDDVELEDFLSATALDKDMVARAKQRIDFDVNQIEDFEIELGSGKLTVGKSDLLERNSLNIAENFFNTMANSVAFGQFGFSTRSAVVGKIDAIRKAGQKVEADELEKLVRIVSGEHMGSSSPSVENVMNRARDLTLITTLPLVAFSMILEVLKTTVNGGILEGVRNTARAVKSMRKNDLELQILLDELPLGSSVMTNSVNTRGLDLDVVSGESSKGMFGNMKHIAMMAYGLSPISDITQRANAIGNLNKLGKFLETGKGLNTNRLDAYGVDDDFIKIFKGEFKRGTDGRFNRIETSEWDSVKHSRFQETMMRLNQEISPENMVGQNGLWSQENELGRMLSTLLRYPMMLASTQGSIDLRYMDLQSVANSAISFGGAYIGLQAKYAMLDKEVDDDMLITYALMNLPQASLLSLPNGMVDNPVLETVGDMISLTNPTKY